MLQEFTFLHLLCSHCMPWCWFTPVYRPQRICATLHDPLNTVPVTIINHYYPPRKPTRHPHQHHTHPGHSMQFNTSYQYYHIFRCNIMYYIHSSHCESLIVSMYTATLTSHVVITTTATHTLQLLHYITKSTSDDSIMIHVSIVY